MLHTALLVVICFYFQLANITFERFNLACFLLKLSFVLCGLKSQLGVGILTTTAALILSSIQNRILFTHENSSLLILIRVDLIELSLLAQLIILTFQASDLLHCRLEVTYLHQVTRLLMLDPVGLGVKHLRVDLILQLVTMLAQSSTGHLQQADLLFVHVLGLPQDQDILQQAFLIRQRRRFVHLTRVLVCDVLGCSAVVLDVDEGFAGPSTQTVNI